VTAGIRAARVGGHALGLKIKAGVEGEQEQVGGVHADQSNTAGRPWCHGLGTTPTAKVGVVGHVLYSFGGCSEEKEGESMLSRSAILWSFLRFFLAGGERVVADASPRETSSAAYPPAQTQLGCGGFEIP